MNVPTYRGEPPPPFPYPQSVNYEIIVRQNPVRGRVAGGKEKERRPLEPPPIIEMRNTEGSDQTFLQSPYYFVCAALWHETEDRPAPVTPQAALAGSIVSSLHRLKDIEDRQSQDGAFFVLGDLSVKVEGRYRLKFTLFEMRRDENPGAGYLDDVISEPFQVFQAKNYGGIVESSLLSRSFAEQGVKLRIRKESRPLLKRPLPRPEEYPTQSTNGHGVQAYGSQHPVEGQYPPQSSNYGYYAGGPEVKRQRGSFDARSGYQYQMPMPMSSYQVPQVPYQQGSLGEPLLGPPFQSAAYGYRE